MKKIEIKQAMRPRCIEMAWKKVGSEQIVENFSKRCFLKKVNKFDWSFY